MGRFDALTQLDKKPSQATPLSDTAELKNSSSVPANGFASKLASKQTDKEANHQISKEVNQQTNLPTNLQASKLANQQTSKLLKKFGSYLTEESLKALKQIAIATDRKDYEVLQEAVDGYLTGRK